MKSFQEFIAGMSNEEHLEVLRAVEEDSPVIPTLYHLMRQALQASNKVDMFDVNSDDKTSVEEFERLEEAQRAAAEGVVLHVLRNGLELINAFKVRE